MYGLLLEGFKEYISAVYGDDMWWLAYQHVTGKRQLIQTRDMYPESFLPDVVKYLSDIMDVPELELYYEYGYFFLRFLTESGYGSLLRVLGRGFVEFLRSLDDLHHHLSFTYHKIKAPTFTIAAITDTTITLLYESKRDYFGHFVCGQLLAAATVFYHTEVEVTLISRVGNTNTTTFTYEIKNLGGTWPTEIVKNELPEEFVDGVQLLPVIQGSAFFPLFPFHILFNESMDIISAGDGYRRIVPNLERKKLTDLFLISRPPIYPNASEIRLHRHNTFELVLISSMKAFGQSLRAVSLSQAACKFKGQMCFANEWDKILFLGSPVLRNTQQMVDCGLYISELSMFDRRRDMILAGDQQSEELIHLYKRQMHKSKRLEKSMKQVDDLCKRTNELLYQCIPKGVARKLRDGTPAIETMQAYNVVSICFTKVVNFSTNCMKITVQQIVELLNKMYTLYDSLTELYRVYKVETIGDSYMLVSGVPQHTPLHAAHITEIALQIIETSQKNLYWPQKADGANLSPSMETIKLLIGCNSGPIVAGVVGYKTPRYCLFGDTVNAASRMMSSGSPDKIHISHSFADALSPYPYVYKYRGKMDIKGKGKMDTYFIEGRATEFVIVDKVTGLLRDFTEVLKYDDTECDNYESDQSESGESMSMELADTDSDSSDLASDSGAANKRMSKKSKVTTTRDEGVQRSDRIRANGAV
ncbi:unnamed protein product [Dicrocoelium dendriticum]|nr:unnamed protein product [Dicrocoelium dendriticum]